MWELCAGEYCSSVVPWCQGGERLRSNSTSAPTAAATVSSSAAPLGVNNIPFFDSVRVRGQQVSALHSGGQQRVGERDIWQRCGVQAFGVSWCGELGAAHQAGVDLEDLASAEASTCSGRFALAW